MYIDGFPRNKDNYNAWFQNIDLISKQNDFEFGKSLD